LKVNCKTLLTFALTIIILSFGINWFVNYGDWQATRRLALSLEPEYLILLVLVAIVNVLLYPLPFKITTATLSYQRAFVIRQAAFAIANTLPAGGSIGVAVIYVFMRSFGISAVASTATISINSVFNVMMTLGMPMLSLVLMAIAGEGPGRLLIPAVIASVLLVVLISGFILILRSKFFGAKIEDLFAWFMKLIRNPKRISFNKFRNSTFGILREKWHRVLGAHLAIQFSMFSTLPIVLFALNQNIGFFEILVSFAFARLVTLVPLTPGGIGTTDGLMLALLISFGATLPAATASLLIWRSIYYLPQVILGLISVIFWQLKINK
jgi:putative heme transporter